MCKLSINHTLEKSILSYCKLNDIEDINKFINDCILQGFNIVKYGFSPKDNIEREINGINNLESYGNKGKDVIAPKNEGEQNESKGDEGNLKEKESLSEEKAKQHKVSVRKIKVIKK